MSEPGVLTVKEFATLARVSEKTVWRWIEKRTIQATKLGRDYRIPASEAAKVRGPEHNALASTAALSDDEDEGEKTERPEAA